MIYLVEAVDTENVQEFLNLAFDCIKKGRIELKRRKKNRDFINQYDLTKEDILNMILQLSSEDCISVEKNKNKEYNPDSILYSFIHQYKMSNKKNQKVFIKMYVDEKNGKYVDVVISFHREGDYSKESVDYEKDRMLLPYLLRIKID